MLRARDIPNLLTILRILLVLPIVWSLIEERYGLALVLAAIAGISDGLDGYLARRFDWRSRLGAYLDPLADKFMLLASLAVLTWKAELPLWLFLLVLGRDLAIVTGAVIYHTRIARLEAAPSFLSKFTTVTQIALVLAVLVDLALVWDLVWLRQPLVWTVALATATSGLHYVVVWSHKARQDARQGTQGP